MKTILYEVNEDVALITFNRPTALNALNREILIELNSLLDNIKMDKSVNIVVFTGMGKAFIAGADISEIVHFSDEEAKQYSQFGSEVFHKIELLEKVTIAAINGYCLGGGNELALACDIRIASNKARFGQPEVTLGITPGFSGTQRLPRLIGVSKAKELLFTGKIIDAEEAHEIGLVNIVTSYESLNETVDSFIKSISKNSMNAVLLTKRAVNEGIEAPLEDGIELENIYFARCFLHSDQKEGMTAFLEKRQANFQKLEE